MLDDSGWTLYYVFPQRKENMLTGKSQDGGTTTSEHDPLSQKKIVCHRALEVTDGLKRTTHPALYICDIDKYCTT